MSEHPERVTLSGRPPETEDVIGAPAPIDPATGMHKDYWILSEEERTKGFGRPVRRTYVHTGRKICGIARFDWVHKEAVPDIVAHVCVGEPDHSGPCTGWSPVTQEKLDRLRRTGFLGGCGAATTMNQAIAETYARDPKFYGATFCCGCRTHLPVGPYGEFVWDGTDEKVGV